MSDLTRDLLREAWAAPETADARMARGRDARTRVPRRSLSTLSTTGRDPLRILDEQHARRVPELVPLRIERMSASPFAFYRGTAAIQAADLARDPHSDILVPSCGDAHLANFGFYASPQRTLVFDLNDFDEAAWAPWEWDLKRLVTSIVVEGQTSSRTAGIIEAAALTAVRTYAETMVAGTARSPLARYFDHFDVAAVADSLDPQTRAVLSDAKHDAEKRTGERATRKLTHRDANGRLMFRETPPTMVRADADAQERLRENVRRYVASASVDIQMLLTHYVASDIAQRVVGVGSVGTLSTVVALQDGDGNALILQAKEAGPSVLVEYGGISQPTEVLDRIAHHGEGARVVGLQRILQAVSDPFLGHLQAPRGDFYVRQLHDMKGSLEADTLEDEPFIRYTRACAAMLARAHSQAPTAAEVAGYIGRGRVAGEAILEWAYAYAAVANADYTEFVAATSASSG